MINDITDEEKELEWMASEGFLSLNLYDENIDKKIEKCSEIYSSSKKYKITLKKLENKYRDVSKKLKDDDKIKLDEMKSLIHQICKFDVYLAYKIGLVDGMKIKNKCT